MAFCFKQFSAPRSTLLSPSFLALLFSPFPPRTPLLITDTLGTMTDADSAGTATTAGTATSADATAGAAASDLAALAVDAKTTQEIKALAPLMGSADLTGVDKPPERASYLTKDAFAAAAQKWLATVKRRVQKLIQQAAGGGGKGHGSSKGNSARGNTTTVDRSLGYVPPTTKDLAKLPNLNTVSRYLTVGLTLDATSQKLTWDFNKSVDHRSYFSEDDFDQGNCGSCWAYAAARGPAGRSCWAYATAKAVQGAYAKLKETDDDVFPGGTRLSVQQLVDCTGSAATCRGGYPEAALQYAVKYGLQDETEYEYTGVSGKCSTKKDADKWNEQERWNISMYEQVPLPGPLGLILALQKQPVIVTIRASSQDFIDYSEGIYQGWDCYSPVGEVWGDTQGQGLRATATATNNTGLLDHVMLAVGYNYEGPGQWNNYFILKNSWGPQWGENGYMRIRMEGDAFGTCGMLVNRGLYAVGNVEGAIQFHFLPPSRQSTDPCGTSPCGGGTYMIYKKRQGIPFPPSLLSTHTPRQPAGARTPAACRRVGGAPRQTTDPCGTSPCGGGTCVADGSGNGKYTCQCTDLLAPAVNRDGTPTCTVVDVCSVLPNNPCAVGQCINSGDGGYSCLCPPNYKASLLASGQTTCVPAPTVQRAYTVQGGETCGAISGLIGLTQEQFLLQNDARRGRDMRDMRAVPAAERGESDESGKIDERYESSSYSKTMEWTGVDCEDLKVGQELNISIPSSAQVCHVRYTVTQADAAAKSCDPINTLFGIDADAAAQSCDAINDRFGIDVTTINPSLDCSSLTPNQQICIQVGDAVSGAVDYNLCTNYQPANQWICIQVGDAVSGASDYNLCTNYQPANQWICIQVGDAVSGAADYNLCTDQPVSQWVTCASIVSTYGVTWFDLYRLNPGINCDTINALTASEICVAGTPLGAVACGKARSKTVANRRYTVAGGDSCASLVVVQFQRQPPLVGQLNRNWMCRSQSLFAGMPLCIPS
ncbi:unnamed protein product [Closterium sp. Naga37s-1]|nr:unnamed protein product [Closterium sp. Naga37s-1]